MTTFVNTSVGSRIRTSAKAANVQSVSFMKMTAQKIMSGHMYELFFGNSDKFYHCQIEYIVWVCYLKSNEISIGTRTTFLMSAASIVKKQRMNNIYIVIQLITKQKKNNGIFLFQNFSLWHWSYYNYRVLITCFDGFRMCTIRICC